MTGGLRVGLSARLAKQAAADMGADGRAGRPRSRRSGTRCTPPYEDLFAWLEGRGERPDAGRARAASAR